MCGLANIQSSNIAYHSQDPEVVSPVNIEVEQVSSRLLCGGFEVGDMWNE
jgi:hypothetical protein